MNTSIPLQSATAVKLHANANPAGLSLRSNASWTLAGNVIYTGCQWAMLMILAKLGSPEDVGCLALALALSAPVFMLSNLQLRVVQATDFAEANSFTDYFLLRMVTTSIAFVAVIGIAAASKYTFETAFVVALIGMAKSFESISDVIYGLVQRHERMDLISKSMIFKGSASIVAFGGTYSLTGSLIGASAGLAAAWFLVMISYDLHLAHSFGWRIQDLTAVRDPGRKSLGKMVRLAQTSLPLGLTMMLISLNTNVPRYFVEHFAGTRALGFFAAVGYLMVAGNLVANALAQAALPRLASYFATQKIRDFRWLLLRLLTISGVLAMLSVIVAELAGKQVLTIFYRADYAAYSGVFTCLMAAAGVGYLATMLGCGMTAARLFNPQLPLNAAGVAVCALVSWILIPHYGLEGAAWALLLAAAAQFAASLGVLARFMHNAKRSAQRVVTSV